MDKYLLLLALISAMVEAMITDEQIAQAFSDFRRRLRILDRVNGLGCLSAQFEENVSQRGLQDS